MTLCTQEGLAANCLDADVAVALAQAAGLIPAASTDNRPPAAAAAMTSVAPSTGPSAAALLNAAALAAAAPPYPTAGSRTPSGSGPRLQSTLPPPSSPLLAMPPASPANVFATGLPGVSSASLAGLFPDSLSPSPITHFPVGPGSARRTESAVTPGTWQASALGAPPGLASPGMGLGAGGAASPVPAQGLLAALGSPRPGLGALGPKYNSLYKVGHVMMHRQACLLVVSDRWTCTCSLVSRIRTREVGAPVRCGMLVACEPLVVMSSCAL